MDDLLSKEITYLKGVGPKRAELLNKELEIHTYEDLLYHFPFRYEDRSKIHKIREISSASINYQIKAEVVKIEPKGYARKKWLNVLVRDETGSVELKWFKNISWFSQQLSLGGTYIFFGRPTFSKYGLSISHPEIIQEKDQQETRSNFNPVYYTTDKLRNARLDSKGISKLIQTLLAEVAGNFKEALPKWLISEYNLQSINQALRDIHFPEGEQEMKKAEVRLKFEELLYVQLYLMKIKRLRLSKHKGILLPKTQIVHDFYKKVLPFDLTNAQKRVIKEIFSDLNYGNQMNRLLQGDVGSGKTLVAFVSMLIAISNGYQTCIMAPTEVLAEQHFQGLAKFARALNIQIEILTGSTTKKKRTEIHQQLVDGEIDIMVGTHALIEEIVQFKNLGLAVIDEQHRFGVAQRAKLWNKTSDNFFPHVLVMTATPIPRTLAMTLYGDLDVSVIDEMPKGRKEIKTALWDESKRLRLFGFISEQIKIGRQAYIIYPLVEESEKLDYKNVMEGYESIQRAFPKIPIGIIHGKMKPQDKDYEMNQFKNKKTKILVATTVIEVGIDVPNATTIVIEDAEKFGLSQLHQLRGRVGRGEHQSYCILMSKSEISKNARQRLMTMVKTNDGFVIAEKDLELRGPGDIGGTQQSGILDFKIANISKDEKILKAARKASIKIIQEDPKLETKDNKNLKEKLKKMYSAKAQWARVS